MTTPRLSFDQVLEGKLLKRKKEDALRILPKGSNLIDFFSNDYLGFSRSGTLSDLILKKVQSLPPSNGATGSRLLSGNSDYTEVVEQKLARLFKAESCLILNSGYSANLAVLSSIPQRGDTLLYDELVHASIKDGARLSLASRVSFKHNDIADLENKLMRAGGNIYVVVESIYSMDGDSAVLNDILSVATKHGATVILDEAHSTGTIGAWGTGMAVHLGLEDQIGVRVYTFGKAMGIHGACVVGSKSITNYLINFSRPFIYTTALPQHSIAAIDCAFEYLEQSEQTRGLLAANIKRYKNLASTLGLGESTDSAIQTFLSPGNRAAKKASQALHDKGLEVKPILSPTVKEGSERLRICLHSFNTEEEIKLLAETLVTLKQT